ncbi:hypothetical protein V6N12_068825 [Hibiscus sabdariffa]|uniref:Uncharacterized protein n=1 Tax=Hibiscus sabdariffa TaxID=183260 RepID=A0ABR2B0S7_9ROSI
MSSKQGLAQLNKDISKSDGKAPIEEIEVVGQKKEMQVGKVLRKIQGHVIDEELWNLKRCLVGVMASLIRFNRRSWTQVEEDAMEAFYLRKENIKDVMMKEVGGRHMGEAEILGSSPLMRYAGKTSWVEIVSNHTEGDGNGLDIPIEELDHSPQRSLENINYLGQQSKGSGSNRSLAKNKSSWVVSIDEKMNASYNKIRAAETGNLVSPGVQSEEDEPSTFFPELSFAKRKKK